MIVVSRFGDGNVVWNSGLDHFNGVHDLRCGLCGAASIRTSEAIIEYSRRFTASFTPSRRTANVGQHSGPKFDDSRAAALAVSLNTVMLVSLEAGRWRLSGTTGRGKTLGTTRKRQHLLCCAYIPRDSVEGSARRQQALRDR